TVDYMVIVREAAKIEGTVIDDAGSRVPFAQIVYSPFASTTHDLAVVSSANERGEFEICVGHCPCLIGARSPGRRPSFLRLVRGGCGHTARLVLVVERHGADLSGVVRSETGEPIGDAYVRVGDEPLNGLTSGSRGVEAPAAWSARTDAGGAWTIEGMQPGTYEIEVQARGWAVGRDSLEVGPDEKKHIVSVLGRAGVINGTVTDYSGASSANCSVTVIAANGVSSTVVTGLDGDYELDSIAPGPASLLASHNKDGKAEENVMVTLGRSTEWSPRLDPGVRASGTVRDKHGDPVREVMVRLVRDGRTGTWAVTDATGRFQIPNIERADESWLEVSDPRAREKVRHWLRDGLEGIDITVDWIDAGKVPGLVKATVSGSESMLNDAQCVLRRKGAMGARTTWPDRESGQVGFLGVEPGEYQFEVSSTGALTVTTAWRHLEEGEVWDLGVVTMPRGGQLDVGDVESLAGAEVSIIETLTGKVVCDEVSDTGLSRHLPDGSYEVLMRHRDWLAGSGQVQVRTGGTTSVAMTRVSGSLKNLHIAVAAELAGSAGRCQISKGGLCLMSFTANGAQQLERLPLSEGMHAVRWTSLGKVGVDTEVPFLVSKDADITVTVEGH
ncbi:MAG: carboxypeptidase-like regulatory domain-containing protein, partial [Planctomycetota bacterium]